MADHNKPLLTSLYADYTSEFDARIDDAMRGNDPALTTLTNQPAGTIRWTSAGKKWEKWSGTAWADLEASYAINISGTAAGLSATLVATKGGTGNAAYSVGDLLYASSNTALSRLADVATGNVLISGGVGVAPSWGKVGLTTHVSGTLGTGNGGTGNTATPTDGGIAYGDGTKIDYTAAGTAKQALVSNGTGVPTWATLDLTYLPDAAFKKSVRAATTAALTASYSANVLTNTGTLAAFALDGITLALNDRVLIKNQATAAHNGIYGVTTVGSAAVAWVLTRVDDANTSSKIAGAVVNVDSGTVNGGSLFTTSFKTTDTLGTTSMTWGRVAVEDANGDYSARYLTMSHAATVRNADTVFYSSTDNYLRKNTSAGFRASLDVHSKAEALTEIHAHTGDIGSAQFRRRNANGDMRIDQRRNGTAVLAGANEYVCDRVLFSTSVPSKCFVQRYIDSSFFPYGFAYCSRVAVNAPFTHTAGQVTVLDCKIEGYDLADNLWGTAAAKPVTVQFLVRTNKTGKFGVSFYNYDINYNYNTSFTVAAAGVVQLVTITIPGATAGVWNVINSTGLQMRFWLGAGANYTGSTANTWGTSYATTSGNADFCATDGAFFHITGVQIELGNVATPFEHRPYPIELLLCQRYYETGVVYFDSALNTTSGVKGCTIQFKATKRENPVISKSDTGAVTTADDSTIERFRIYTLSATTQIYSTWEAKAEL